jgi:hypothetical protein
MFQFALIFLKYKDVCTYWTTNNPNDVLNNLKMALRKAQVQLKSCVQIGLLSFFLLIQKPQNCND